MYQQLLHSSPLMLGHARNNKEHPSLMRWGDSAPPRNLLGHVL